VRDDAGGFGELVEGDLVAALGAEHYHLVADLDIRQVRDIRHGHVHRDSTDERSAPAADQHAASIAARARQPIGITAGDERYAHRTEHFVGAAIADRGADPRRMKANDAGFERNGAAQRADARDPASGVGACQGNARADRVEAHAGDTQGAGGIGHVLEAQVDAVGFELLANCPIARQLLVGEERVGVIGGSEVRIETFEAKTGEALEPAHNRHGLVGRRTVASHAGVDFDLDVGYLAGLMGGLRQALDRAPVSNGGGQVQGDGVGVVFGIEAAQLEDGLGKTGLTESTCFANAGDGGAAGTCLNRRGGHGGGAHAIRLRLHDCRHAMAWLGGCLERSHVVFDSVQVDLDPAKHRLDGKACIICGRTMATPQTEFASQMPPKDTGDGEAFSRWYISAIRRSELADYFEPVGGTMVIRPYGFSLWENMQAALDQRFKATGHKNAYFPLFVPESFLKREAKHVEGFAPEVAWVTNAGGEDLQERLAIRPTSETIIGHFYSKWIHSWRDLPLLINQWCNIVRWEKRTVFFLRTTEFLWQEGHTAHRTAEEAREETMRMLGVYADFAETECALPVVRGEKTAAERFAGADSTYSIEALMPDGKALQSGTSHFLGQNFARAFDITFLDQDGQRNPVWTTSWGMSTRILGGTLMMHGDDAGLILPPRVAPIQVVVVPIPSRSEEDTARVNETVSSVLRQLESANIRAEADWSDKRPGWKFAEWELKGVPLRIEVGPRDLQQNQVTLVRRDSRAKEAVPLDGVPTRANELLAEVQRALFDRARAFTQANTHVAADYGTFKRIMQEQRGFIRAYWCGSAECEARIKEETRATIRVIPEDASANGAGHCICDDEPAELQALFAQSY
jgi:prolyl-tRNA synthetase